ncbi:GNAT family N-acetyltransferase [Sphingomonas pituitosa]|uniref:GNAT family N-acetyltransferase n=1 Tax=Sphingomonas pituitosa TaxID=99597 RepID=UPI000A47B9D2|nr:GNAT family N-acetyltransferase [Sphingomonas pituitosa]
MCSGSASNATVLVAGPEHVTALLPLIQAHARFERTTATCTAAALRSALAEPDAILFAWLAIDESGRPMGYATATRDFSTWSGKPFLHLDCLYIAETARGAGVGTKLLGAVKHFAVQRGIAELQWQTPEWNAPAERFYLQQGAAVTGKRRFRLDV